MKNMEHLMKYIGIEQDLFDMVHTYKGIEFRQFVVQYPSIFDYLRINAKKYSKEPFIIEVVDGEEKQIVNYKEFYTKLLRVSYVLRNIYKISTGIEVAVLPNNSLSSVYIILGIMLCGGIAVIINPTEPIERIKEQIKKVNCFLTIIDSRFKNLYINSAISIETILDKTNLISPEPLNNSIKGYQPATIIFTTGTTSTSKAVVQMHYNITVNCEALIRHHKLNNKKTLLCTLPIYHVNGLEFTIFSTMMAGSCVVLCNNFDPFIYFNILTKYKVTIASLVPPTLNSLIEIKNQANLSSLDYFVTAAAPLSSKTSTLVWEKFQKQIIQGYGLTETTNFSTLIPLGLTQNVYKNLMIDCDIPSVGQEVFGNEVVILDNKGNFVQDGDEGEICMRGHNIMAGYLNEYSSNKKCFAGGWFHSGDTGKFIFLSGTNEKFLKITGRIKNIIKVNGQAVSLDEIDRIILNIKGVQDCLTCGIYDQFAGELPLSFVVKNNDILLNEEQIINHLLKFLNQQKIPKKIIFVSKIPRTKNGKVNRNNMLNEFLNLI